MTSASPLVSPERLSEQVTAGEACTLLDVRWSLAGPDRAAYEAGHLPGAVFVDLDADLAGPPGPGGRHPLPDLDAFAGAMRRAGVTRTDPVVVLDQGDGVPAARAWWLLVHGGHPDVRLLDGGVNAWVAAGLELSTSPVRPAEGDFACSAGGVLPVLDADGAAALARAGVLLDVRAAGRYLGDNEPVDPVAGHVPGARNAPTSDLVGADGRLLPASELRRYFAGCGADGGRPVGVYCGSGVSAARAVLALRLSGVEAALYAGSWSEWVTDPARPVATGPTPG